MSFVTGFSVPPEAENLDQQHVAMVIASPYFYTLQIYLLQP